MWINREGIVGDISLGEGIVKDVCLGEKGEMDGVI